LNAIKNILKKYTAWIWAVLGPLGPWGVFAIAAVDGSFLGMPIDFAVATYVYQDRRHFLFYVVMASAGSALGSLVIYGIGYLGGETLVRKRIPAERFAKIHASFERHEFWAVMFWPCSCSPLVRRSSTWWPASTCNTAAGSSPESGSWLLWEFGSGGDCEDEEQAVLRPLRNLKIRDDSHRDTGTESSSFRAVSGQAAGTTGGRPHLGGG